MDIRRLAPLLVAAGLGLVILVVAPEIVTGTFSDLDTFLRAGALVGGLVLWVVVVRRFVPHRPSGVVVAALPVAVALWVVLWPYLRPPTEVDEAFPPVTAPVTTPVDAATSLPPTTSSDPATTTTGPTDGATTTTTTAPAATAAPAPVELARAPFQGLTGHRGSGDAALYRLPDGSVLLRFEEVDIGSGPDLDVYVVPGGDQRGPGGGTHVAPLTAERGNQNYVPPGAVDLTTGTWTVLVWCETFAVEVANATLMV